MKKLLLLFQLALFIGCSKNEKPKNDSCDFTIAKITDDAPTCQGWGIVVGGVVYPSRNIPDMFKQDGLTVCTNFALFEDPAMCPCCGGTYANILFMSN